MLKLGWTYNMLKDDREAVRWFNLAQREPRSGRSRPRRPRAYRNLKPIPSFSAPRFGCSRRFRRAGTICSPTRRPRPSCVCTVLAAPVPLRCALSAIHAGAVDLARFRSAVSFERAQCDRRARAWRPAPGTAPPDGSKPANRCAMHPTQPNPGRLLPDYRGGVSYAKASAIC